jgi:uncharacterized radical SAM protein YgiQ
MNKHFLPITKKELDYLGWDYVDVVLISGDAYVDHPSFAPAVIGRTLEGCGYRVAILPQPNWQDDLRDFKKLGKPRLFFAITAGNMDSMVNHYTAFKRLRSDDAYTPGGQAGFRPDYATMVYSKIVRQLYPDVPIVIGGVEASMRRLAHYDYWSDSFKPSILAESGADILIYGMGERPVTAVAKAIEEGDWRQRLQEIPQIGFIKDNIDYYKEKKDVIMLHSFEEEKKDKHRYAEDFVLFERESNKRKQRTLVQQHGSQYVVINPPFDTPTEEEMDRFAFFDRMMNAPHPKYLKRGAIPAFEMIKNSITIHRGCFGGCSFCAIAAHQGKYIASRSEKSVLAELEDLSQRDYFKGHVSDLGGPSANMYRMHGKNTELCERCPRPSCIFPQVCKNLNVNHKPIIELYRKAMKTKGVKHITIGSGIRYDMLLSDAQTDKENGLSDYIREVVNHHVSGRLKVAPEHTASHVLQKMRKPDFDKFQRFLTKFNEANRQSGKNQQLIPYFISSHPGCTLQDMKELSKLSHQNHLMTEQVQDFTPTPMTYSTAMYYLGFDPYTGEKVHVARDLREKREQNGWFFTPTLCKYPRTPRR